MFEVEVRYFKNINRKSETMLLRSVVPYSIPKHLSNVIDVVFGLTSFPASRPVIEMSKRAVQQFGPSVDPNVIKKTMHIGNFNGTGRTDNIQVREGQPLHTELTGTAGSCSILVRWCANHTWTVVLGWVAILALLILLVATVGGSLKDEFEIPGSDTQRATDLIEAECRAAHPPEPQRRG